MRIVLLATTLLTAVTLNAQEGTAPPGPTPLTPPGTYTTYGTGCPGSGQSAHVGTILPASHKAQMGNSNNYYPFGRANQIYQQVMLGSELGTKVLRGFALRQTGTTTGRQGGSQTYTIFIGGTTYTHTSLTTTYANNFNVTASKKTQVFSGNVNVPTLTGRNTDPAQFAWRIMFTRPVPFRGSAQNNLLMEVRNTSTTNVLQFWDAASQVNAARMWASPVTATSGRVQSNYGVIMCMLSTGSGGAVPKLSATGRPIIGRSFSIDLAQAKANTAAVLLTGAQQLNLDLTGAGAPGCRLLTSTDVFAGAAVGASGTAKITLPLPQVRAFVGVRFYSQWAVIDAVNALKLVFSNGGIAFIGDS